MSVRGVEVFYFWRGGRTVYVGRFLKSVMVVLRKETSSSCAA